MEKIKVVHSLVHDLLLLIDKGESVEIGKIREKVYDGTLVSFLKDLSKEYFKQYDMYLQYIKEEESNFIISVFDNYVYGYSGREDRKLGISNNGLVILVLYGVELIIELERKSKSKSEI